MASVVVYFSVYFVCLSIVKCQLIPSQDYSRSTILDAQEKIYLYWEYDETHITIEVHVNTLGWVGFGISPNGAMIGADIQVGWVKNGIGSITDRHGVNRNTFPPLDNEQNVELLASAECGGWTMIKYRRQLAACEVDYDLPITTDTLRVIYAYGESDPTGDDISGSDYHRRTRGVRSLLILDGPSNAAEPPASETRQEFTFLNSNFQIPAESTYYSCTMFKIPDLSSKVHLIEIEPVIETGNELYVHHIVIYQCFGGVQAFEAILGTTAQCYSQNMPNDFNSCRAVVHAWAIGGTSFSYPLHVGLPLGEADSPKYILMETHYDNPNLRSDVYDNSGLRLIYTPQLRQFDAGVMETGHTVFSIGMLIPPNANNYLLRGECTSECLGLGMDVRNVNQINVFGTILHSHLLGRAIELKHIRNGRELEPLSQDNSYDFNYQETRILSEERVVLRGDDLQIVCHYQSAGVRTEFTKGGLGTAEEMCLAYLFYYPKLPLTICETSPHSVSILNYFGIENVENIGGASFLNSFLITSPSNLANQRLEDFIYSLNFNDEMARNMSKTLQYFARDSICADGHILLNIPNKIPSPRIQYPFIATPTVCMEPTSGFSTTGAVSASCSPITAPSGCDSLKSNLVLKNIGIYVLFMAFLIYLQ